MSIFTVRLTRGYVRVEDAWVQVDAADARAAYEEVRGLAEAGKVEWEVCWQEDPEIFAATVNNVYAETVLSIDCGKEGE